jgi:hypothetical protein
MAPLKRSGVTGDKELVAALRELAKGPTVREIDQAAAVAMAPMLDKTKSRFRALRNYAGKWSNFFTQPSGNPPGGHVDEGIVFRKSGNKGRRIDISGLAQHAALGFFSIFWNTEPSLTGSPASTPAGCILVPRLIHP